MSMKITLPCYTFLYQRHVWGKVGIGTSFERLQAKTVVTCSEPEVVRYENWYVVVLPILYNGSEHLIMIESIDDDLKALARHCITSKDDSERKEILTRMRTRLLRYSERTLTFVA